MFRRGIWIEQMIRYQYEIYLCLQEKELKASFPSSVLLEDQAFWQTEESTTDDFLIAQMLQKQYDREFDNALHSVSMDLTFNQR